MPANWCMDALAKFYKISQGSSQFLDFVTAIQTARNSLTSSGTGFTVNDSIQKNHLLFFCHPILSLRVRSIPNFKYGNIKLDTLIGLMASTWDSMVAENIVRPVLSSHLSNAGSAPLPFLSDSEHERLKLAGGCFHCQRTPTSPRWVAHGSRDCPGDKAKGIPPAPPRHHVSAVLHKDASDEDKDHVDAVLPSCVLLGDGDSDSDEESF